MKNVILIGMPGAGKSTVGVVLAKVLGYDFIDSDLLIQKEDGRLLWQIIRDEGIEGFKQIEERVNSQKTALFPLAAASYTGLLRWNICVLSEPWYFSMFLTLLSKSGLAISQNAAWY